MFQNIALVIETIASNVLKQCDMFLSLWWGFETMRHDVSITLAMFWNNAMRIYNLNNVLKQSDVSITLMRFYYFSDVLKQFDAFLLLWRYFETNWCVSITLAMVWNNVMRIYYFRDVLKQCDAFLLLWRCFVTMLRVIYHLGAVLYSNRPSRD